MQKKLIFIKLFTLFILFFSCKTNEINSFYKEDYLNAGKTKKKEADFMLTKEEEESLPKVFELLGEMILSIKFILKISSEIPSPKPIVSFPSAIHEELANSSIPFKTFLQDLEILSKEKKSSFLKELEIIILQNEENFYQIIYLKPKDVKIEDWINKLPNAIENFIIGARFILNNRTDLSSLAHFLRKQALEVILEFLKPFTLGFDLNFSTYQSEFFAKPTHLGCYDILVKAVRNLQANKSSANKIKEEDDVYDSNCTHCIEVLSTFILDEDKSIYLILQKLVRRLGYENSRLKTYFRYPPFSDITSELLKLRELIVGQNNGLIQIIVESNGNKTYQSNQLTHLIGKRVAYDPISDTIRKLELTKSNKKKNQGCDKTNRLIFSDEDIKEIMGYLAELDARLDIMINLLVYLKGIKDKANAGIFTKPFDEVFSK